jgi:NADH:ubiquinone oxidoreductase subunit E
MSIKEAVVKQLKSEEAKKTLELIASSKFVNAIAAYLKMPYKLRAELIDAYDNIEDRNLATLFLCFEFYCLLKAQEETTESFEEFMNFAVMVILPASEEQN